MQAIIGTIMAVSSFGAAYATQLMFPVKPVGEADILLSQTTIGTVNMLDKETLEERARTPRELISFYLKRQANLADVIEIVTGKSSINEAYAKLKTMDSTPEIQFLIKATEKNYSMGDNAESSPTQQSVGIGTPIRPAPSAPPAAPEPSAPPSSVGIGTPITPSESRPSNSRITNPEDEQGYGNRYWH